MPQTKVCKCCDITRVRIYEYTDPNEVPICVRCRSTMKGLEDALRMLAAHLCADGIKAPQDKLANLLDYWTPKIQEKLRRQEL